MEAANKANKNQPLNKVLYVSYKARYIRLFDIHAFLQNEGFPRSTGLYQHESTFLWPHLCIQKKTLMGIETRSPASG